MRSLPSLLVLCALVALTWAFSTSGPTAASSAPGGGPTGALGILPDPNYPPGTHTIDLAVEGVYDPALWAVILDYQSLTVQDGAKLVFENHPTRAPVVIRAVGPIVIDGEINLDGEAGLAWNQIPEVAQPGPGGFRGGPGGRLITTPSDGFGPGGGFRQVDNPDNSKKAGSASHRSEGDPGHGMLAPTYGSPSGLGLVGGSGGAGSRKNSYGGGGGAGGGALLIGSDTSILVSGELLARGGHRGEGQSCYACTDRGFGGAGSGGLARVFAPMVTFTETARLETTGGNPSSSPLGGHGCIRVESTGDADVSPSAYFAPAPSWSDTLGEFLPSAPPRVAIVNVWDPDANGGAGGWLPVTSDPLAKLVPSTATDVELDDPGPVIFKVEGREVPLGAPLHVRTSHVRGQATIDSAHAMGTSTGPMGEASTLAQSWTDVTLDLSEGVSAIQVRAELP